MTHWPTNPDQVLDLGDIPRIVRPGTAPMAAQRPPVGDDWLVQPGPIRDRALDDIKPSPTSPWPTPIGVPPLPRQEA